MLKQYYNEVKLAFLENKSAIYIEELTNKVKQYESIEIPSTGELDSLKNDINYKQLIIDIHKKENHIGDTTEGFTLH